MRDEWKEYKLGDLCKSISMTHKFDKDKLIFLNTGDIEKGKFLHQNYSFVSSMPGQAKKTIRKNDVLFSEIRPANGRYALVDFDADDYVVSTKLMVIRCNDKLLPKFLYHFLTSDETTSWLQHLAESRSGTFPQITFDQVADIDINLPPKSEQEKISTFISAIDDKIELNRQANQTLEAIAQTLFKEWFVEFNFPDTTGEMQEGELGSIPVGWRVGKLGEVYNTMSGGTPSRNNPAFYADGTIHWIKSKELNNSFITDTEEKITEEALRSSSAKVLKPYSVLIAMYGATVGEVGIISMEATCNQAVCAFLPSDDYPYSFIYHFIINNREEIISRAVGSAQQNISQDLLKRIEFALPPSKLVKQYHEIVHPLLSGIENNIKENQVLSANRDALLPKLMNGEIEL